MALILPNTIINGEVADAAPVQQNYKVTQDYINTNAITRDGAVAMVAPLLLQAGDPTADRHAANKQYVDSFLPVGIMVPWPSPSAPGGGHWMLCNGAALAVTAYGELYGVLGTRYGSGTGTFKLPNLTGRTMFGYDPTQSAFDKVGNVGGSFNVPVPPHAHPMPHTHTMPHTHEIPHTHPITHNHAAFNAPLDNMVVQTAIRDNSTPGTTQSLMTASATGISAVHTDNPAVTGTATIDVPNYTGDSGQPDDATTNAASSSTTSGVSTANTANNTDALTTGTTATTMVQPYVTVNFIIRVL